MPGKSWWPDPNPHFPGRKGVPDFCADIGLVAEEVADVIPDIVIRDNDGQIEGFNYNRLGAVLVGAFKEMERVQLSGTIGQWDATAARELSGGHWRLTGGFWGMTLEELADALFLDRFEQ